MDIVYVDGRKRCATAPFKMKTIGVIPARLNSTRLPRKALTDIHGLPMCVHVYRRALMSPALDDVIIATDNQGIYNTVHRYGAKCFLTKDTHPTPTERVAEIAETVKADFYVQINGDEPLLNPAHIRTSVNSLIQAEADASVLARPFDKRNSPADFKLVLNKNNDVMYVTRSDIPSKGTMLKAYHIMSFTRRTLQRFTAMRPTAMEQREGHELLRLIENGLTVTASVVNSDSISVDVPEDLDYVRTQMLKDPVWSKYK